MNAQLQQLAQDLSQMSQHMIAHCEDITQSKSQLAALLAVDIAYVSNLLHEALTTLTLGDLIHSLNHHLHRNESCLFAQERNLALENMSALIRNFITEEDCEQDVSVCSLT